MRRRAFQILACLGLVVLCLLPSSSVSAAYFNPNNLIDDSVFDDKGTMSAAQIDSFLNTLSSSCISSDNGFSAKKPTGYSSSTGFTYGSYVSAGQVIYAAAQAYDINPQILLTTLQKEQSLVSGGSGICTTRAYAGATGYGCPDGGSSYSYSNVSLYAINGTPVTSISSTCVNSSAKVGFSQQVIRAAWLLKFSQQHALGNYNWAIIRGSWDNSDDLTSCYSGPMTQGTFKRCSSAAATYYDGYITLDSTSVHMDTGATAALYWYTPHFHGNQNFDTIFQNWFGSLIGSDIVRSVNSATVYLVSGTQKYPIPSMDLVGALYPLGSLKFVSQQYLDDKTTGDTLSRLVKGSSASLYFFDAGIKLPFSSCTTVSAYGLSCASPILLTDLQIGKLSSGPAMTNVMNLKSGETFGIATGTKRESFNDASLTGAGFTASANTLSNSVLDYLPFGTPILPDNAKVTNQATKEVSLYGQSTLYKLPSGLQKLAMFNQLDAGELQPESIATLTQATSSGFVTDGTNKYVLTDKGKAKLLNPDSWTSTFSSVAAGLLSALPDNPIATFSTSSFIKSSDGSSTIFNIRDQKKLPIASWQDLLWLAGSDNPQIVNVPAYTLSQMTSGQLQYGSTRLIKAATSKTVYIIDGQTSKRALATFSPITGAGLSTKVLTTSSSVLNSYTTLSSNASQLVSCGGVNYLATGGSLKTIDSTMATRYGFTSGRFVAYDPATCGNVRKQGAFTATFLRSTEAKTIFYIENGVKHPISSMASYADLGGNSSNTLVVESPLLTEVPTGSLL
jgi:hypothetical protein